MRFGWKLVIYAVVLCMAIEEAVSVLGLPSFLRRTPSQCCAAQNRMDGKIVLVTGSNTGIGYEAAKEIFRLGARIIMACRNLEAAFFAKRKMIRELEMVYEDVEQNIIVLQLDLSSFDVVHDFNIRLRERQITQIHVLIHNAGIALAFAGQKSYDGFELIMATNYYGPYLLTHLLIDLIREAAKTHIARIVVVSSVLHKYSTLNVENLRAGINNHLTPAFFHYCDSKHANILFAVELSRRLGNEQITVNALHPGLIKSDIWRCTPAVFKPIVQGIVGLTLKTTKQGAQTTICCAIDPQWDTTTGRYFDDCQVKELNNKVTDANKARTLWINTGDFIGMNDAEKGAISE